MNEKEKRNQEVACDYIKKTVIFIVWQILILLAMQVDKAYQNRIHTFLLGDIVKLFTDWGHAWEISYDLLYNALDGFSSILLAVIGMIVSGWINLSDRLEQAVYGIRRKELFSITHFGKVIVDFYIGMFLAPVWMVYALIRKYCFTAYFIMAMIFVQFLISNVLLAQSYSSNHDYIKLRKKILYSLKKVKSMNDFFKFDGLLDRIGSSTEEIRNWSEINMLFFDILEKTKSDKKYEIYRISNTFLSKIFADKNRDQLLQLMIIYTQKMSQEYKLNDKTRLVYWVLLDNMYQNCSEYQVNFYLDRLFDILSLNRVSNNACTNLFVRDIEDIFSMIVLQTEGWLQENDSELRDFGKKLDLIFKMGNAVYVSDRSWMLLKKIDVQYAVDRERANLLFRCYQRLKRSYLKKEGQTHMGSLVESIAAMQ